VANPIGAQSLLSFILPDIIGRASEELRAIFKVPIGAQANLLSKRRIDAAKNVMTPFVLRRKKLQVRLPYSSLEPVGKMVAQVLQELPSKSERIEFCELTPMQLEVYREAVMRSKKALTETTDNDEALVEALIDEGDAVDVDKAAAATAAKGRKKLTKKGTIRVQQNSSANVLMDLRKAANHPMLFRRLYDDAKIRVMSKDCLREMEFSDRDPTMVRCALVFTSLPA
jgi:SWI/SNF-related matrix-associated actin-dependent regulator 1 of chromatin subfamily A